MLVKKRGISQKYHLNFSKDNGSEIFDQKIIFKNLLKCVFKFF